MNTIALFSPSQLHLDNKPDARGSGHATGLGWTKAIGRSCLLACLNRSEILSRPWSRVAEWVEA